MCFPTASCTQLWCACKGQPYYSSSPMSNPQTCSDLHAYVMIVGLCCWISGVLYGVSLCTERIHGNTVHSMAYRAVLTVIGWACGSILCTEIHILECMTPNAYTATGQGIYFRTLNYYNEASLYSRTGTEWSSAEEQPRAHPSKVVISVFQKAPQLTEEPAISVLPDMGTLHVTDLI